MDCTVEIEAQNASSNLQALTSASQIHLKILEYRFVI